MSGHNTVRHVFGRYDRIMISGAAYRSIKKEKGNHVLQLMVDDAADDSIFITKSDDQISQLLDEKKLRVDYAYFSQALATLRMREDTSDLNSLSEEDLQTVAWRKQWCVRFHNARRDPDRTKRPSISPKGLKAFIEKEKDSIHRWYIDQYKMARPLGRIVKGQDQKLFDYPGPTTLRNWLDAYRGGFCRADAFKPKYHKCGNRDQLDSRAVNIVQRAVESYASRRKPTKGFIYKTVEKQLRSMNRRLDPDADPIRVSEKAIRRRINLMDPFTVDFGRHGEDYALRKYTPVGSGLQITRLLERVEMDDWEVDLHGLIIRSSAWKLLPKEQRKQVPRKRFTVSVAIDCASRCIVGFNISPKAPSTPGAKASLRSIMMDKSRQAAFAGAKSSWHMAGQPFQLATDGGPVFRGEFRDAAARCNIDHLLPDQDPRMRGTIESFFKTFKQVCRYFAGQTFANVVEKGDYKSEEMASATFEQFAKSAIRYIVDIYHHHGHQGLEGGTPFARWQQLARAEEPIRPSDMQLKAAFSFQVQRNIDKNGIRFLGTSYQSFEAGRVAQKWREKVDVLVDPDDLGSLLVILPPPLRGKIERNPHDRAGGLMVEADYIEVPTMLTALQGKPLIAVAKTNAEVRAVAQAEQAAGRDYLLDAHADLLEDGESARAAAGLPSHEITQKGFDLLVKAFERKSQSALGEVKYAEEPAATDEKGFGTVVAVAKHDVPKSSSKSRPAPNAPARARSQKPATETKRKPFGGSINLHGEEE